MSTLIVAVLSFFGFILAYNTYGRWLGGRVFQLDDSRPTPANTLRDEIDFVPTRKAVLFGHHFTTIAGTGPIVGPAIAVCWGWLPAILWVVFGAIFIGAVHDMTALVISMRNNGKSIGDVARTLVSQRVRILFLLLLAFVLTLVVAVFCTIIAGVMIKFPQSVLCVWLSIPMACLIGYWNYKIKGNLLVPVLGGVAVLYLLIWLGTYYFPITLPASWGDANMIWTIFLLIYCFCASTLPVWLLLQPRDFINSCQLYVALALLISGLFCAALFQQADLFQATPAIVSAESLADDGITAESPIIKSVLPLWPFLFITIACGAISGFHALVASGTTSKQIARESDAVTIGYGAMLLEGALAVIVILACTAGISLRPAAIAVAPVANKPVAAKTVAAEKVVNETVVAETVSTETVASEEVASADEGLEGMSFDSNAPADGKTDIERLAEAATASKTGEAGKNDNENADLRQNWLSHYNHDWPKITSDAVGSFVEGGGNFLTAMGFDPLFAMGMMGVLIASFAATTLDSATRLQRYVLQELGLKNMYLATLLVVFLGGALACMPSPTGKGTAGMLLWPLFGATNQLLASLTLVICMVYLKRNQRPLWFLTIPLIIMTIIPAWAMILQMIGWASAPGLAVCGPITNNHLMIAFSVMILAIQLWVLVEGFFILAQRDLQNQPQE